MMPTVWTPNTYRELARKVRDDAVERADIGEPMIDAVGTLARVVEALVDQCELLRNHKADAMF